MLKWKTPHAKIDIVSGILMIVVAAQICISVWAVKRGFDFSDEAYSFLAFRNPEQLHFAATYYASLFYSFFGWLELDIFTVRVLRTILILLSSAAFAYGVTRALESFKHYESLNPLHIYLASAAGFFLFNATGSQMLTYNFFSASLLGLSAAIFLMMFFNDGYSLRKFAACGFLLGATIFAIFTVKFPNAFIFLLLVIVLLVAKGRWKQLGLLFVSGLTGFLLMGFFVFGTSLFSWLSEYGYTLFNMTNSTSGSLWEIYQTDFYNFVDTLLRPHWLTILISASLIIAIALLRNIYLKLSAVILLSCLWIYVSKTNNFFWGGMAHRYWYSFMYLFVTIALLIADIALGVWNKFKQFDLNRLLLLLFILAIPLVGSLGTNSFLTVNIEMYMAFIFVFIYLIAYHASKDIAAVVVLLIAVNSACQGFLGLIYSPYRITHPLTEQKFELSDHVSSEQVCFDSLTKKTIEDLHTILKTKSQFRAGMPIFAYRGEYGLVYLMKGILPGWCWYKDEVFQSFYCDCVRNSPLTNLQDTFFILPTSHTMDPAFVSAFHERHVNFPDGYAVIGNLEVSEGQLRPLTIYAPKALLK